MTYLLTTFFLLMVWHALADYPLQGDYLAEYKHPKYPRWWWRLSMHCLIHAGGVYMVTASMHIAMMEFCAHWIIDFLKCKGVYGDATDQWLHVLCKVAWVALIAYTQWEVL